MRKQQTTNRLANYLGLGVVLFMFIIMFGLTAFSANKNMSLVVFTANWCANCRDVVPMAQNVATTQGVSVTVIDVDASNAPKQAEKLGLSIPTRDLPQIYLKTGGTSRLVFDGSRYIYGQTEQVRMTLLKSLKE